MADRRLQVFHTVARQLSFTRAAEQLCMTQPAVTFQIKQLEEHFDARLFERDRGGIVLTAAGRMVFQYAERILELNDELDQRVGDLRGAISGPLLLGCSMTIAEFILPRVLGEAELRRMGFDVARGLAERGVVRLLRDVLLPPEGVGFPPLASA